ncbi:endonuclease domain-containing protein [Escherichia coli]|uniref:endonuclease domain-containing protein n=1 Tax=Escherichia coli TaxID=562 RepID=UPI00050B43DD|nr:endonuclease domain-containing protein [Escherichia coli]
MVTRTDQLLRKAMRGYLEYLGNMPLAERIKNSAAFDDVYHFLLNGSGRLELRRADVAAVRVFLWNYQYRRCAVTAKPLRLASAVLDHCHRTGRVRAVVHRSANAAEGGYYVGNLCGLSRSSMLSMLPAYRRQYKGLGVIYPRQHA